LPDREHKDPFLAWLQRVIQERQKERTEVLQQIEPLRKRQVELDAELRLLEKERQARVDASLAPSIPDFPPVAVEPDGSDGIEEQIDAREAEQREAEEEAIEHHVGVDLARPEKTPAYKKATLLAVRTWFYEHREEWVKTGRIAEETGIPRPIVSKRCDDLLHMETVINRGNRASSRWKFNEEMPAGPKVDPVENLA
jgi:hypothetical protein